LWLAAVALAQDQQTIPAEMEPRAGWGISLESAVATVAVGLITPTETSVALAAAASAEAQKRTLAVQAHLGKATQAEQTHSEAAVRPLGLAAVAQAR